MTIVDANLLAQYIGRNIRYLFTDVLHVYSTACTLRKTRRESSVRSKLGYDEINQPDDVQAHHEKETLLHLHFPKTTRA